MRGKLQQHFRILARTVQRQYPYRRIGIFFAIVLILLGMCIVASIERQQHVYEKYVDRMLAFCGPREPYTYDKDQTIVWLSWLATEMENHNQTEAYLERLQPSWLPEYLPHRGFHHGLTFRLVREMAYLVLFGIFSGLVAVLFNVILYMLFGITNSGIVTDILNLLIFAGIVGLVMLLYSLGLNILSTGEIHPAEVTQWKWENMRQHVIKSARAGIVVLPLSGIGAGVSLIGWLIASLLKIDVWSWGFFGLGVTFFILSLVMCGLFKPIDSAFERAYSAIDTIIADNKLAMIYGPLGGGLGLLIGMENISIGLLKGGVIFGIVGAFFGWMLNGLTSGLHSDQVAPKTLKKPNEGIRRSAAKSRMYTSELCSLFRLCR